MISKAQGNNAIWYWNIHETFSLPDVCPHCFLSHSVLSHAVIYGDHEVKLGRSTSHRSFLSTAGASSSLFLSFFESKTQWNCVCCLLFSAFSVCVCLLVKTLWQSSCFMLVCSECSPLLGRKPESLASENSFVTHLCHPVYTLGGPWRNWILARQCNGIFPGDGCDTGSAWRGGRRARRRCPIARAGLHLQPVRRSIYLPRCCRCSNGFVIGLRFSYISGNAVTSPRRPLHNLPGISPLCFCNASM